MEKKNGLFGAGKLFGIFGNKEGQGEQAAQPAPSAPDTPADSQAETRSIGGVPLDWPEMSSELTPPVIPPVPQPINEVIPQRSVVFDEPATPWTLGQEFVPPPKPIEPVYAVEPVEEPKAEEPAELEQAVEPVQPLFASDAEIPDDEEPETIETPMSIPPATKGEKAVFVSNPNRFAPQPQEPEWHEPAYAANLDLPTPSTATPEPPVPANRAVAWNSEEEAVPLELLDEQPELYAPQPAEPQTAWKLASEETVEVPVPPKSLEERSSVWDSASEEPVEFDELPAAEPVKAEAPTWNTVSEVKPAPETTTWHEPAVASAPEPIESVVSKEVPAVEPEPPTWHAPAASAVPEPVETPTWNTIPEVPKAPEAPSWHAPAVSAEWKSPVEAAPTAWHAPAEVPAEPAQWNTVPPVADQSAPKPEVNMNLWSKPAPIKPDTQEVSTWVVPDHVVEEAKPWTPENALTPVEAPLEPISIPEEAVAEVEETPTEAFKWPEPVLPMPVVEVADEPQSELTDEELYGAPMPVIEPVVIPAVAEEASFDSVKVAPYVNVEAETELVSASQEVVPPPIPVVEPAAFVAPVAEEAPAYRPPVFDSSVEEKPVVAEIPAEPVLNVVPPPLPTEFSLVPPPLPVMEDVVAEPSAVVEEPVVEAVVPEPVVAEVEEPAAAAEPVLHVEEPVVPEPVMHVEEPVVPEPVVAKVEEPVAAKVEEPVVSGPDATVEEPVVPEPFVAKVEEPVVPEPVMHVEEPVIPEPVVAKIEEPVVLVEEPAPVETPAPAAELEVPKLEVAEPTMTEAKSEDETDAKGDGKKKKPKIIVKPDAESTTGPVTGWTLDSITPNEPFFMATHHVAAPVSKSKSIEEEFEASFDRFVSTNKTFKWKRIGELLKELGVLSEMDLQVALTEQQKMPRPLGQVLVDLGYVSDRLMLKVLAAQKDVVPWYFDAELESSLLALLEPDFCRRSFVLPVQLEGNKLTVAMRNPSDIDAIDHIKRVTGFDVEPALADEKRLEDAINDAFSRDSRSINTHVQALAQEAIKTSDIKAAQIDESMSLEDLEEGTRPVVGIVNKIILDGIRMRASDIHIEPTSRCLQVRYRIDGRLQIVSEIPSEIIPMVTARIKIMAELDPVEWRIPQDGRLTVEINGQTVDLRLSVLPSFYGGRIVMRILDRSIGVKKLEDIGFSEHNLAIFKTLIKRPYGLFLVTGPTGSGKTTSLYAALNAVKDEETNIITCEDPVEYNLDGISQSQVNAKIGLTFAAQLRSILRQDPDVVLVGEIRDQETAETAVRASMTGHMVFSTLHCNDAPSAVPRLLDMGIDPFLLSTSLIGVMGQRLLRVICKDCREAYAPTEEELELLDRTFGVQGLTKLYRGAGCMNCGGSGYKGRMAVHEIMPVTHELGSLIARRAPTEEIAESARWYGYRTMQEDTIERVIAGRTTLKEAQRLLAFDDIPKIDPNAARAA